MESPERLTVLIVEDDVVFRQILVVGSAKRSPQARIAEAGDLAEARARAAELGPDVVFVDVSLPDGNGLALIQELRQGGSTAVIAVCTGHDTPEYRDAAERLGATRFLSKTDLTIDDIGEVVAAASRP